MRKILDKMFANKKISIFVPIAIAALVYLLFVFFGVAEDKANWMIMTPIISVLCFFGVFLVVFVQVKNTRSPEWFLNLLELLPAVVFVIYAVVGLISFLISGFQDFYIETCVALVAYGAVSWAHSKRTK